MVSKSVVEINGQKYYVDLAVVPSDQQQTDDYGDSVLRYDDQSLATMDDYTYFSLKDMKKKIRLLRLQEGNPNDTIRCELFEVDYEEEGNPVDQITGQPIEYEALSWCWGKEVASHAIRIRKNDLVNYKKKVTKELALALRYLRRKETPRILWIDALCIDQGNDAERNHQVQMMSLIYTRSKQVCVWLGEANRESRAAIAFIKEKIMNLKDFDSVSKDETNVESWQCLLMLMQRPWFSRRWVVQEIALAQKASVYCGWDEIEWTEFAIAVELFVEVESATHRLSEVMQKDPKYYHLPGWFEHVSQLGASLLVSATGKVFRQEDHTTKDQHNRRGLLGLEFLVSSLAPFKASEPRDAVYSLLAIAKDTFPFAEISTLDYGSTKESLLISTFSSFMESKPYFVDYSRSYTDVCKDFISFCIQQSCTTNPARALDILCRPWALLPDAGPSIVLQKQEKADAESRKKQANGGTSVGATQRIVPHKTQWTKLKPGQKPKNEDELKSSLMEDSRDKDEYWRDADRVWKSWPSQNRSDLIRKYFRSDGKATGPTNRERYRSSLPKEDLPMPSWVATIDRAAYEVYPHPGFGHIQKMGRKNADPLVGLPLEDQQNYSAAQTKKPDKTLRFRKRPILRQHSLYVKGFILDEVLEVHAHSQLGSIPIEWAETGNWTKVAEGKGEPPSEFWRTLVADRGKDNRNPPYYYATACKEAFAKGGIQSGSVNTGALIEHEQNSIITEFCRRVQAVIWNRRLIRTRRGTLGLASQKVRPGDLVCIIYGCTVPVILRKSDKKPEGVRESERFEDQVEALKVVMRKLEQNCVRKYKRFPIWAENDSSWRMGLSADEREQARFTDKELRCPNLYKTEIEEETKAINKKMKIWKEHRGQESQRKREWDECKDKDEKRLEEQRQKRVKHKEKVSQRRRQHVSQPSTTDTSSTGTGPLGQTNNSFVYPPPLARGQQSPSTPPSQSGSSSDNDNQGSATVQNPTTDSVPSVVVDPANSGGQEPAAGGGEAAAGIPSGPQTGTGGGGDAPAGGEGDPSQNEAERPTTAPIGDGGTTEGASSGPQTRTTSPPPTGSGEGSDVPTGNEGSQPQPSETERVGTPSTGPEPPPPEDGTPQEETQFYKDWKELEPKLVDEFAEDDNYFFTFLGESYIHGMMDGEAMREQFQRQHDEPSEGNKDFEGYFKERIFELR